MHLNLQKESPLIDGNFGIRDLIDLTQMERLCERFSAVTGFTIALVEHPEMNILIATGWKDICTQFHRSCRDSNEVCIKSNRDLIQSLNASGNAVIQQCDHGLIDCAIPIVIEGKHIATLGTGQMLFKSPDIERFRQQAAKYGFDESAYLAALAKVDRVDEKKVKQATEFLGDMAHLISQVGYARLRAQQEIERRKHSEAHLQKLSLAVEQSPSSIVITNMDAQIEYVNRAFLHNTGYSRAEIIGQNPRILQSGRGSKEFYREMWEVLSQGQAWKGEFHNKRKDGGEYTEFAVITPLRQADGQITHYVAVNDDITARRAAEDEANSLAFFDHLTKLPNRRLLIDRLKHAVAASGRNNRAGALLLIDLDDFKTLNDTLGHEVGDLLLQQVAQRLSACVREGDTVGRLGGDEFLVILENLSENTQIAASQAQLIGEMILSSLSHTYQLAEYSHLSTPSIGITLFEKHKSTDDLLKQAELAMYQAKSAGRSTLRFFDPEMQKTVSLRAGLETDLREAIAEKQFFLHYQAQIASDGRLMGAEVLLRWLHPVRGMVQPAEFIPLAEDTKMILPIGHWVLKTACAQLARWASQPEMSEFSLSVNVSARQFKQPGFVKEVLLILERTGANPKRLKLELTENMLVENVEDMIVKMSELKGRGVSFSLDDFGTGYSSLSYLKRLPLDQLKIDQGFVRDILTDPNDAAIAKTIIALADSLGLGVIAEGVEFEAQKDFLARHGCHAYQGYFYGRPLPIEDFEPFARTIGAKPGWVIIG
ncbi:MAG: EAL domain-containing protein [Betaproteobacteria bacterium]